MAMSKYETIMWEEKMKEQILAHFRILHAEELTPVSVLDVISTKPQGVYKSYVIMIDTPRSTEYKILLSTEGKRSVGDGLERLLITLRQRLAPCLGRSL
ncbi:hypothetical protein AA0114_g5385 [Alternaria tenuissima]|uniref:Uncharacterized protein n=1 Tax=Alternaria tenuissima TaxID=119927 RepID=A0A4Q4MJI3_9PLEO|nr:hypothetical protein AA0114_g5385 [Alternaria tenuissima]